MRRGVVRRSIVGGSPIVVNPGEAQLGAKETISDTARVLSRMVSMIVWRTFAQDAEIYGLFPHTHLRGIRWEYTLVHPDGRTEKILDVPRYDFNWQTYYMFSKPLLVTSGSKILSAAWYDNSTKNPYNPDASVEVRWGDQTWEEMQYTGITYAAAPPAASRDRR